MCHVFLRYKEQYFEIVKEELRINNEDMIAISPHSFFADELLFFSIIPELFPLQDKSIEEKVLTARVSLLVYAFLKMHILADDENAPENCLEMAVLSGDYLSGRFGQLCVEAGQTDLLEMWFEHLMVTTTLLTKMSLGESTRLEKDQCNIENVLMRLLDLSGLMNEKVLSASLATCFCTGKWHAFADEIKEAFQVDSEVISRLEQLEEIDAHRRIASCDELESVYAAWVNL